MNPSPELAHELAKTVLAERGINLSTLLGQKFEMACYKAIVENPDLDFNGLRDPTNAYLNFIIEFPDLEL